ncbi:MotA/TolQ/ExbB proton channel domain-containing protein [Cupriavidus oxalaticus]|uniref:anti-phage ZorAB system protein ZorA n=1 Tax=Cupriavidus oxalaticus TaxID=96344 RepID=UPI003F7356BA
MTTDFFALISNVLHWGIGGLLLLALAGFVMQFLRPALRTRRELRHALEQLEHLKAQDPVLDLDRVASDAMLSPTLRHCWNEYRDTLHGQKQATATGMMEVARWRATAMANGFFTEQALVESPLRSEFYKHLPGILTGLGIIGTFAGLILGLQNFHVSDDAAAVRGSLESLIFSVGGAFMVSGIAIFLAMAVTTVEKMLLNGRYTQVEALCGVIDSLFDSGAGEEYLQRLVEASETSATQAMQMKESLVTDLKQVLSELTQQQIATITSTSAQLGQSIANSLSEGLAEPLQRISHAVESVGNSQGEGVSKLLMDVLANFTAQMEGMFGTQMRGMNDMLVQTANTIQTASLRFERLAEQIQDAGTGAADAMAKRMDEALQQMQARQAEANDQMRAFVDELRRNVANGQSESAELTRSMMRDLSESTGALVRSLQDQAHAANQAHAQRQADMEAQNGRLVAQHAEQLAGLTTAVNESSEAMRQTVARLEAATNANVERMGLGAERLQLAANRLGDNLDAMRAASESMVGATDKLDQSARTLDTALLATQQALGEQKAVRDAVTAMVTALRDTVEHAKREAGMTSELVGKLEAASRQLAQAEDDAANYLEEINDVLTGAHGAFAQQVEATLRHGNKVFHEELAQATSLLKGAIQDLADVLDTVPTPA